MKGKIKPIQKKEKEGEIPQKVEQTEKTEQTEIQLFKRIGINFELQLTEKQKKALEEAYKVKKEDVEIKPTGEIYIPWSRIYQKLNEVFGVGNWMIVPLDKPSLQGINVIQPFALLVNGKPVSIAYGGAKYIPENPRMSFDDAIEACHSYAIRRLAKHLGIFAELWDPDFIESWKEEYAEKIVKGGKEVWKKKTRKEVIETEESSNPKIVNLNQKEENQENKEKEEKNLWNS